MPAFALILSEIVSNKGENDPNEETNKDLLVSVGATVMVKPENIFFSFLFSTFTAVPRTPCGGRRTRTYPVEISNV